MRRWCVPGDYAPGLEQAFAAQERLDFSREGIYNAVKSTKKHELTALGCKCQPPFEYNLNMV
jgi:hypothetical protein